MKTEILGTEKLTDERWINLFARTYRRGEQVFRWVFASRRAEPTAEIKPDAVLIVPILIDGPEPRLVLTREYRVPLEAYEWGFPAGLIDGDESPLETARRELLEETGYELVEVTKISPPNSSSSGLSDEQATMVYCTCRKPSEHRQRLESTEEIEVIPLTLAEIAKVVDTREPINARAWMAVYMYHRLGRLE